MSTQTSIGAGPGRDGSNESRGNADGLGNKTLGENAPPELPAGVPGSAPKPGIRNGPESFPDGPNVEDSPWEPDAARGKLPPQP